MTRREYLARVHELCPRGNALPQARLNPEAVRAIRGSRETSKRLAQRYGVHLRTIENVRSYRNWVHVA